MMQLEVQTPEHGAAFQILYEAVNPAFCQTRERRAEIEVYFAKVSAWAVDQPQPIRIAYSWAMSRIMADIDRAIANADMSDRVRAAYEAIPKPEVAE